MTEDWQSGFIEANGIRLHYTRTRGDNNCNYEPFEIERVLAVS
jgi:hypothetical protein